MYGDPAVEDSQTSDWLSAGAGPPWPTPFDAAGGNCAASGLAAISKSAANNIAQRMICGPAKRLFTLTPLLETKIQISNCEDAEINVRGRSLHFQHGIAQIVRPAGQF